MQELTFGQYLKKTRSNKKISQRSLALKIGVDFTYLSKIENNKMPPPSEETLKKIAKELNENVDNLIFLADKIPSDYIKILQSSKEIPLMLRILSNLSKDKQREVFDFIKEIDKNNG